MLASPVVGAAVFALMIVEGRGGWLPWLALALFVAGTVFAVVKIRAVRRAIREFEDRYGPGAGIQH